MSYINITNSSIGPVKDYVAKNWVSSEETSFVKKQVLARGAYLILAPASLVTSAVDAIIGVGAGIGAICALGKHKPTCQFTIKHLHSSDRMIAEPYVNLLKALNPDFELTEGRSLIGAMGHGFTSHFIREPLKEVARSCYDSDSLLKRHVASRLTYALLAIASVVTRAVDGVIGVPAAALSLLTLGKFESLNHLAYRGLQVPGIINDLFYCTIKLVNPWTGTSKA